MLWLCICGILRHITSNNTKLSFIILLNSKIKLDIRKLMASGDSGMEMHNKLASICLMVGKYLHMECMARHGTSRDLSKHICYFPLFFMYLNNILDFASWYAKPNIYYLIPYRISLPTPGLEEHWTSTSSCSLDTTSHSNETPDLLPFFYSCLPLIKWPPFNCSSQNSRGLP